MGSSQESVSVQNDGNFSELAQYDPSTGLLQRIEAFRASQPNGAFGTTASGTTSTLLSGSDYLVAKSSQIHRFVFSVGQKTARLPVVLEGREELDPLGMRPGSWDCRIRDLDPESPRFGQILRVTVEPTGDGEYLLQSEFRWSVQLPVLVTSPLLAPISELANVPDIGAELSSLSALDEEVERVGIKINTETQRGELDDAFSSLYASHRAQERQVWARNVDTFLEFGDRGEKSVHPGVNLVGEAARRASDALVWRAYRASMVDLGRISSASMSRATESASESARASNPGVYRLFLTAYKLGIRRDQLVLDKVYSDYGGIPMALRPGSRLETGREPLYDASRAIRTLADLADAFFLRA